MQPGPGDRFGRYRLEALVGEGGMGRVFRGHDATLQRRVAIKLLRQADDGRVLREARAAAALDHPGVVAVFDVGEANGQAFIVMEYVVGRSLRALIEAGEATVEERLRWLTDVARALAAAHRAGLVHRDIKPENVMIREDGAVKLLDFGIARLQASEEVAGSGAGAASSATGTPAYMAPEQVQRRGVDARADQFGWGVLAYELLTGATPWPAGVPVAIAVVTEPAPALGTNATTRVAEVVARALEKAPERRFASMEALVEALVGAAPRWIVPVGGALVGEAVPAADTVSTRRTANATGALETGDAEPEPRASRRGRVGGALGLGVAGAMFAGWMVDRGATPPSPGEEEAEAWQPSALAREAFDHGVRRVQRAALHAGIEQFERALEYEPEYAAAHLRAAFLGLIDGPYPVSREPYHAAVRLRGRLDARERGLLDALEPAFARREPALDETIARLEALAAEHPDDAELRLYVPMALSLRGRDAEAVERYEALLAEDPDHATALLGLAYVRGPDDELAATSELLDRCLAAVPDAIDCLWYRIKLDAFTGRCEAMEATALRWGRTKPNDHGAATSRLYALVALGRSDAELAAAEAEAAEAMTATQHAVASRILESARRIAAGDFVRAERLLAALPDESALDSHDRLRLGELQVALHEEMGDLATAAAIAGELRLRRADAPGAGFVLDEGILADPTPFFDGVLAAAGSIDAAERDRRRDAWLAQWRGRGLDDHASELWLRAFAGPTRTAEDARAAIAALPAAPVRRFITDRLFTVDAARVYLLAGRPEQAAPLLREATRSCLVALEPLRFVQAHALLGDALAATGEREAACEAYAAVRSRWAAARPRSRTAEAAAASMAGLGCAR
ncbi:MAG: protein kinase [Myxococcales bacterium]|nr:protein kinase [Myxococcales bacterium]